MNRDDTIGITLNILAITLALIAILMPDEGQSDEIHTEHCINTCPTGHPATNDVVVRQYYTLSSNDETKFADWVAYRLTPDMIGKSKKRVWRADPRLLPMETLEPADYKQMYAEIGMDRGHQAPLADFSGTHQWQETNYLSNITPQRSALNQGSWQRLESAIRDFVRAHGFAYILTGPLYERAMPELPGADEPHRIPSGYWKVILVQDMDGSLRADAFIFDQETPRDADYCGHVVSVAEVEVRSGLDVVDGAVSSTLGICP